VGTVGAAYISHPSSKETEKTLQPGSFFWLDDGPWHGRVYQNDGDREARFIAIAFPYTHF